MAPVFVCRAGAFRLLPPAGLGFKCLCVRFLVSPFVITV
nr:MAG TPA: hypothetical protein [Caudoviricetes sp.]